MRIISVVGKVDSRVLVYPLARALSMQGLTGIITDDGSYRRLYPGKTKIGCINGIDISVNANMDESTIHSLDNSGIDYDNLIFVSYDYIHPESDGIIICHGVDRSIMALDELPEEDEFIIPKKQETVGNAADQDKNSDNESDEQNTDKTNDNTGKLDELSERDKLIKLQEDNPNRIFIPDKPYVEVQIGYAPAPKNKDIIAISIKDGLMKYVYTCEEQHRIIVNAEQNYVNCIAKIASKVTGIDAKELAILLTREEGSGAVSKK